MINKDELRNTTALYDFWLTGNSKLHKKAMPTINTDWNTQIGTLSKYGVSMEEALQQVFAYGLDYEAFIGWVAEVGEHRTDAGIDEDVLTEDDLAFWEEHGYLVVKNVFSKEQCEATTDVIWDFLDASPLDSETWYQKHPGKNGMMLRLFNHPVLNENRNSAIIKKVYAQLYKNADMYLFVDKVSFNPPEREGHKFNGSPLHWDLDLTPPIPLGIQGLVYLNDVRAEDGAFHCVPGFHKKIDCWLDGVPDGVDPQVAIREEVTPIAIPGNAGDLIVWHHALPHCATPNKGTVPRLVQYIAYTLV